MAQIKPNWETVPPRDWAEEQAHRVANEVRRLRGKRSAQWLAGRTGDAGYPVSRTVISDLENGRRRYVTTAELCALACGLGVAPVRLLYPDLPDGSVRAMPDTSMRSIDAVMWFSGEAPWQRNPDVNPATPLSPDELAASRASALLEMSRERVLCERGIERISKLIDGNAGAVNEVLVEQIEAYRSRIRQIDEMIPRYDGVVTDGG